ncbi:MAG: outer membrane lipoprotein carrier protein LolA [Bacteroidales bacterium]|nr:outer membrane lipoprotein carrier protein LolA [Bacteroidales bacterium]
MKKHRIFVFLFCLTSALTAQQAGSFTRVQDAETLKTEIKDVSENTSSIQSDFIQEKHLTMLKEVLISNGRFLFRKENDVRWEYLSPIDYTIVIYNGKFTIRDGKKINEFDISSNALFQQINKMIVTAIRGDFVDNPEFESSFFASNKQYLVRLKSVNEQVAEMLTGIEIYFNRETLAVEEVKFVEPGEDYTLIVFKNRKLNIELTDKQFELNDD